MTYRAAIEHVEAIHDRERAAVDARRAAHDSTPGLMGGSLRQFHERMKKRIGL